MNQIGRKVYSYHGRGISSFISNKQEVLFIAHAFCAMLSALKDRGW